jgi:hypothetical protein
MRPVTITVGPLAAASANAIALSQTPGAAGPLTLNGALVTNGVAVMDTPRQVLITTADSTHNFTITGTSVAGDALSETIVGSAASSYASVLSYATVTSVTISGAATAAVTVGTNGIATSNWAALDEWASPQVGIQTVVTGTVNYTIQSTYDNPNGTVKPIAPSAMTWINTSDTNAVGATVSLQTNYLFAPRFVRILLNSGSGSVLAHVLQYNVVTI